MARVSYEGQVFEIGTRVYIEEPREDHELPPDGSTGVVVAIIGDGIGVEFDQPFSAGHTGRGKAKQKRGRYYTVGGSLGTHESIAQIHVLKDDDAEIEETEDLLSFINSFAL